MVVKQKSDGSKKMMMVVMAILVLISLWYLYAGLSMHAQVTTDEATYHSAQRAYWAGNDKVTRDAAPANSDLNNQLADILNTPSDLLRLKLVGVGRILTGIFLLLLGILMALVMMPVRLGQIIKNR